MMGKRIYKIIIAIAGLLLVVSCSSRVVPVSQRGIDGFNKPGQPFVHGRSAKPTENKTLYTEKKEIQIVDKGVGNETGSLYNLEDQRNFLFLTRPPLTVGQYLSVKVVPNGLNDGLADKEGSGQTDDKKADRPQDSNDAFVKEMLAQLPELDPGPNAPPLVKNLKMRIEHVYDNGDALVSLARSVDRNGDVRMIEVKSRIPASALLTPEDLTTQNLSEVQWTDSFGGENSRRNTPAWEDEYSLRLSGFSESKSLYAQQLEEKRKQLQGVREKLNNQLVTMGQERQKNAKEREEILKKKAENENKMMEMEQKFKEISEELADYKEKEREEAEEKGEEAEEEEDKDSDEEKDKGKDKEKPAKKDKAK